MDKLYNYLTGLVQEQFSDSTNGYSRDMITQMIYTVLTEDGVNPDEEFSEAYDDQLELAVSSVAEFTESTESDLALFSVLFDAEENLGVEFSEDDITSIQEDYSQCQFSDEIDESDLEEAAYSVVSEHLDQNEYAFMPTKRDSKMISRDITSAGRELGVIYSPTRWEKIKNRFKKKPESTVGKLWVAGKNITKSNYGQLVAGTAMHRANIKLAEKINKYAGLQQKFSALEELSDFLFSEAESVVAERTSADNAKANAESTQDAPVSLDKVIALADHALPNNVVPEADPTQKPEEATKTVDNINKSLEEHVKVSDDQTSEQPETNFSEELEQSVYGNGGGAFGNGYFLSKPDEKLRPGVLGSGRSFQSRLEDTLQPSKIIKIGGKDVWKRPDANHGFDKSNRIFSSGKFFSILNNSMQDAIAEGLITGVYYQSLDSGLKIGAGTISRGYKGVEAMIKPSLDKLQSKMESAGSNFANWALPDGPSGAEIIDGMNDKEASEIVKTLDQAGWLSKLPEQARTVFLMNLSKSGVCYIDERGTLKKRNIIDKLIRDYETDPDRFFENLPGQLEEIKDLYKATALISKDSINTEAVYNRLKSATSVDQVRSILIDELNVIKKPLVSLADLTISLSNDFISLMKTDKRYYRSLIDKIARSVEAMARDKGADSLSAISSSFLRNLSMSDNESEIRRTVEKLIIANIRYLNDMLGVSDTAAFSEQELEIQGANVNMENSPVKSTGGRTNIEPANLGKTAGWNDADMEKGSTNPTTDPLGDAKDEALAKESTFSVEVETEGRRPAAGSIIKLDPSKFYSPQNQAADRVNAPGFGVDAVQ